MLNLNLPVSRNLFRSCFYSFAALLFPWQCPGCTTLLPYREVICKSCYDRLVKIARPWCRKCGAPIPEDWIFSTCLECRHPQKRSPLTGIRSAYNYDDTVLKSMVHRLKYGREMRVSLFFGEALASIAFAEFPKVSAVTFVPLQREREWSRTFNQSELIARQVARRLSLPLWDGLMKRESTPLQSSLSGEARRRNLKDAFAVKSARAVPQSVILIDDVMTTGTTLMECAASLRASGSKRIYGLTVARALKKIDQAAIVERATLNV